MALAKFRKVSKGNAAPVKVLGEPVSDKPKKKKQ